MISARYPRLRLTESGVVEGILDLRANFAGEERNDSFAVHIAPSDEPLGMPTLTEVGGRTAEIAAKHGVKNLADLHRNPGGSACLCVKQDERNRFPKGSTLAHFIEGLAVPYLFGLSHFDDTGKWPWPEYSHGALGIAEYCGEARDTPSPESIAGTLDLLKKDAAWREFGRQIRKPSAMRSCVCGSRKPISRCHKGVWKGVQKLNHDILGLGLGLRRTLQKH
ncbi:MAG TPA: hypothetical protein VNX86_00530 [Rhizomicrobium sp.]|nr:hypothetical protein [Rhizomicrobium sp.]